MAAISRWRETRGRRHRVDGLVDHDVINKIGGKSSKVEAFEVYVTEILTPAP